MDPRIRKIGRRFELIGEVLDEQDRRLAALERFAQDGDLSGIEDAEIPAEIADAGEPEDAEEADPRLGEIGPGEQAAFEGPEGLRDREEDESEEDYAPEGLADLLE